MVAPAPTKVEVMEVEAAPVTELKEAPVKPEPDTLTFEDIKEQVRLIERSVASKDSRFMTRVIRSLTKTKKHLNSNVLRMLIGAYLPSQEGDARQNLMNFVADSPNEVPVKRLGRNSSPEAEAYLHLLLTIWLLGEKKYKAAVECARKLVTRLAALNRRSLDLIAARAYYYFSLAVELNQGANGRELISIRSFLHARYRTAVLHSDVESQAVLLCLLLRNYLSYRHYDSAARLVAQTTFPESASNPNWARYHYYLGQIKLMQLDYSVAEKHLQQALRKAPQQVGLGFREHAEKWLFTCQLLLGEIPARSMFGARALEPYYQLTVAVRRGNLVTFAEILEKYGGKFQTDGTLMLIQRLRHNVLKTGLKRIALAYSNISLADVASRLHLDSAEDAEYIVAKAIRDGVIEAHINRTPGQQPFMASKEPGDVYSSTEPLHAYHERINYCLELHSQSVQALRFPNRGRYHELDSAEERRERQQQEMEAAKDMTDDDFDGFP